MKCKLNQKINTQLLLAVGVDEAPAKPKQKLQGKTENLEGVQRKAIHYKRGTIEGAVFRLKEGCRKNIITGCLEWKWKPDCAGYASINALGRKILVHRLAYELQYGKIPEGMLVRHSCDNPICCNPEHLKLGTQKDNMNDCAQRGRKAVGEKNGVSKLTNEAVQYIRRNHRVGHRENGVVGLARKYNVARTTIYSVLNNINWKHITSQNIEAARTAAIDLTINQHERQRLGGNLQREEMQP